MASGKGDETYQQRGPRGPLTAPEEVVSEAVINHRRGAVWSGRLLSVASREPVHVLTVCF